MKRKQKRQLFTAIGIFISLILIGVIASFIRETYLDLTAPEPAFNTKEEKFINQLSKHAQEIQAKHQILTSVTLAQAILESNWGESELASQANNLFGVKGRSGQPVVSMPTKEFTDGKWIEIKANFRKYTNWNESLDDHAQLFVNGTSWSKTKYHGVLGAKDYKIAAQEIMKAGYATDPDYASKLISIVEKYNLHIYDNIQDKLITNQKISKWAKVNSEENATIWTLPYGLIGAQKVEDIQYYKRDDLKLVQEAVTSSGKWYQFAIDEKVIGWIKADFIKIQ
ncbi:glucosaminidase domain-containing protein [Listeria fleischmannii]|jgi:hypothetical protein|uniref:glucosaminidase domain-containing protein n=1 Tax=Listeria fleischmannii TaxID=1069827 RepID=UPI000586570D|nr:glucosaminidase domain-containing protein [Listeria fleischmannii]STY35332.1 Exo-glucosaminidase lytG precursor [Listeria fleischmannii subsp. coloradonensis]